MANLAFLGHFGPFLVISAMLSTFEIVLVVFSSSDFFKAFLDILWYFDRFGHVGYFDRFNHFGHFDPFQPIFIHFH